MYKLIKSDQITSFLSENNLDAVFVSKQENCRYISGFTGGDSFLFLTKKSIYLLTDSRYTEQAEKELTGIEVINHGGKLTDTVAELARKHEAARLGVEASLPCSLYIRLRDKMPQAEISVCEPDVFRQIKTVEELKCIAEACRISDEGFKKTVPYIRAGRTENELRTILECAMLEAGSEGKSFDTIVASGERSAMPHGTATDKVVEEGDVITFDFGAIYHGYHSDITRTVAVGDISDRLRNVYDTVLGCVEYMEKTLRAGEKACDADARARAFLKERKMDTYFTHALGHSVGLEIHEKPILAPRDSTVLRPGMTETIEPGVYIPHVGGVRIEDTVAINENGISILTKFPKQFLKV